VLALGGIEAAQAGGHFLVDAADLLEGLPVHAAFGGDLLDDLFDAAL
jgi:hypothetical protein